MKAKDINPGGRKKLPVEERRGRFIKVRLNQRETEKVDGFAEATGVSRSEYVRTMALRKTLKPRMSTIDEAALVELNRIGRNVNTGIRKINIVLLMEVNDPHKKLHETLVKYRDAFQMLMEKVDELIVEVKR